jgi:hypothetical protein
MVVVRADVDWFLFSQYLMVRSTSDSSLAESHGILAVGAAQLHRE